ncbi:MAG: pectinesterase family protein [Clostridia bacterium]|nr:pectinesterase family protein [Clostridia bacterium]
MKSSTKHLRLFMIALFTCIACVCLVFGVTACSGGKSSGSIDIDETSVTISVGETHTITATATEKDGGVYTGNYVWTKDGDAIEIMTNGNSCMIKGISAGQASITVTAGSYSVRCDVTVIDSSTSSGTKNVETVSIEPTKLDLYVGQSGTVSASLTVTGGTTYTGDYEWESSDTAVATVTKGENGSCTVTAVGAGTATITVTVGAEGDKKPATCTVTVREDSIATLELSEEAIVVAEEGTSTLIVTVKMTSGESSTDFEAKIEDDSIATIATSGNVITVTGVDTGETKITVTAGGITKECTVTVKEPEIAEITLSKTSVTLGTSETATVDVTVKLDNGKTTDDYTASASCEPEDLVTANVANGILTITAGETEGSVKITVTVGGTTISAECNATVTNVQKEYYFDFSDATTYGWLVEGLTPTDNNAGGVMYTLGTSTSYTTGIVKYTTHSSGNNTINSENAGALFTAGASSNFAIDLSAFEGLYVSITVRMSTNGDDGDLRTLYVNNNKSTSSGIKSVTSSGKEDYQTLEYGEVISANETLYLTWSKNIRIFTIEIKIMDPDDVTPEVRGVTLDKTSLSLYVEETDYLTATVEMTIGNFTGTYEWTTSDDTVARVEESGNGATVIAEGVGTAIITVRAGGKEATCTVTVVERGEENQIESFIVPMTADAATADTTQYSAGAKVVSNSLFELTTVGSMKYSIGGSYGNIQKSGSAVTFTDISGVTHNPDQGLLSGISLTPTVNNDNSVTAQSNDDIIEVKALADATVYVYLTMANNSYSVHPTGVIYYSVNGGEAVSYNVSSRATVICLVLELEAGDVVKIGASNSSLTSSGAAQAESLWLFGAEAVSAGGTTGGGASGDTEFEEDPNYEWVDSYADLETALAMAGGSGNSYKTTGDTVVGKFTFGTGVYFENSNSNFTNDGVYCVNNQQKNIYFTVKGTYNNISLKAVNGSSGTGTITIYTESGTALKSWSTDGTINIDYAADTGLYLAPGTYYIGSVNSFRFGNICLSEYLEKSAVTGMTVKTTTVDFLKGRSITGIDLGISATLDYENGRQDSINLSDLDIVVPTTLNVGENTVTVTYNYTDDTGTSTPYTESVTIYVYYVVSIDVTTVSMEYTNSTYITHNLQQVFLVGDTFNYDYIVVTATCSCGVTGIADMEFILKESEYNVATPTLAAAGAQTVTVSVDLGQTEGDAKTDTYTIHVVEITSSTDRAKVQVYNTSDTGNAATYAADAATGIISVATINDAIKLLELMGATDAERKYIYVGAGEYWEKIYIDMPNLSLIGSNTVATDENGNAIASRSEETVIVYDAMNGVLDPSGTTTFSTVGSATVTVSSNATGFIGANITFRNYWNTNALYNEALKITSSTQADAAYINADRSYFYNVTFTGYHDTLEAENGRQYYDHCYIEGRTDYIFGNTATCYFDGCIIHTIGAGSTTNGGYVMAIKGGTDSAHVDYGYVFNGCSFITDLEKYYKTGDEGVAEDAEDAVGNGEDEEEDDFQYTVEGTVSVARTWSGSNMHIAILNSSFDEGFSTTAYGTSGKNPRYTAMSGDAPTPAYLVEYNNSGEGAITSSIDGTCTVLTETEAANYTISNIFSTTNGGISYDIEWDPTSITIITVSVEDGSGNAVATIYATDSISVSDLVDAINARLSDFQVNDVYSDATFSDTAVITSAIDTTTTVYVKLVDRDMSVTKSSNWDFTNSNYGSGVTSSGYLDADEKLYLDLGTSGGFSVNGGYYVMTSDATISLILNPGSTLCVGTYTLDCLTATDGEGNAITMETSGGSENKSTYSYTNSTDGQVTVKLGVYTGESAKSLYFMYINVSVGTVTETTTYSFTGGVKQTSIEGCIGWYLDIKVDATSGGKFQLRGDGNADAQTNTGTVLYIQSVLGAQVSFNWYPGYGASEDNQYVSVDETGLITIQISPVNGSSAYIYSITVTVPAT